MSRGTTFQAAIDDILSNCDYLEVMQGKGEDPVTPGNCSTKLYILNVFFNGNLWNSLAMFFSHDEAAESIKQKIEKKPDGADIADAIETFVLKRQRIGKEDFLEELTAARKALMELCLKHPKPLLQALAEMESEVSGLPTKARDSFNAIIENVTQKQQVEHLCEECGKNGPTP